MRIAVTCALSWPFIRRGNRCAWDLAVWLAGRGHEITFLTPTPGTRTRELVEDDVRVQRLPLPDSVLLTAAGIQKLAAFVPICSRALRRGRFDVVQSTYPVDAAAAAWHRRRTGTPYAHMVIDCLPLHPKMRFGPMLFARGAAGAARLSAISAFVAGEVHAETGLTAEVIPLPTDVAVFFPGARRERPAARIVCTASLVDARKNVARLVAAFPRVLEREPEAELVLSGHSTPQNDRALLASVPPAVAARIHLPGLGRRDQLPALYRGATLSVLPSVDEAFGLVVVESLACGTHVVAHRSGALPEILDDPAVGTLADPAGGEQALAQAVLQGLERARRPDSVAICRQHVLARYTWDVLGPRYEELLRQAADERPGHSGHARGDAPVAAGSSSAHTPAHGGSPSPAHDATPAPTPVPIPPSDDLTAWFEAALDDDESASDLWFERERARPLALAVVEWLMRGGRSLPRSLHLTGSDAEPLILLLRLMGCRVVDLAPPGAAGPRAALLLHGPSPEPPPAALLRELLAGLAEQEELIVCWRGPAGGRAQPAALVVALRAAGARTLHARRLELSTACARHWGSTPVRRWLARVPAGLARRALPPLAHDAFAAAVRGA